MKNIYIVSALFLFVFTSINTSCKKETEIQSKESVEILSKAQLLHNEINKNCNLFTGNNDFPIINAEEVYNNLNNNYLIIDIRGGKDYADGHIKGAINLKLKEIIDYAQVSGFPDFEKVVLVCYTGQSASYGTAVLQMLGYNNVYAMKWGMTSWNSKFTAKWKKNISDKLVSKLKTKAGKKESKSELPEIISKKNSGPDLLKEKAREILTDGFGKAGADLKFLNAFAKKLFIISHTNKDLYSKGHLKGAIHFDKEKLNTDNDLLFLPTDIKIAVCSEIGHKSAFITAFLRMLGYDAKTVKYGTNSFMVSKMEENSFNNTEIHNYNYETSVYIHVEEEVSEGGC